MTYREWQFSDILQISKMEAECFPQEPWSYNTLVSCFSSPSFCGVLAEDGGEIVGYGGISVVYENADIENIAVGEAYRRSGIGSALLQKLIERAKKGGAKQVFLEVRVSNSAAMIMYLKHGFVGKYVRSRYYSDGEDCLVMCKTLI